MRSVLKIKGLRIFVAIMEEGSLARASERNHLSPPAASRTLRLFEEAVGESMFFRTGKRLIPTQEAEFLYPEAVRILDSIDHVPILIKGIRDSSLLPIRILCLPRIVDGLVLPAMVRLHAAEPRQRFVLEIETRRGMGRRLTHGDYDIGVSTTPLRIEGVESHFLTSVRLCIMISRDNPMAMKDVLRPGDLFDQPYIALNDQTIIRQVVQRELAAHKLTMEVTHVVSSSATAYRMVRYNMGFTFADPLSVPPELLEKVRLVRWEPASSIDIVYFYPRAHHTHSNREIFIQHLKAISKDTDLSAKRGS